MEHKLDVGSPEQRVFHSLSQAERAARKKAEKLTQTEPPASPHFFMWCDYCAVAGKGRGTGLIAYRVQYFRADREPLIYVPSVSTCPACNGYGYVLTALGRRAEQGAAA